MTPNEIVICVWMGSVILAFCVGGCVGSMLQNQDTNRWREKCFDNLEHYRRRLEELEGKR